MSLLFMLDNKKLKLVAPGQLIFVAAYTFFCVAAIFFLVRGAGVIAGLLLGSNGVVAAALSQLVNARIGIPVWIPFCGAVTICALRELLVKRLGRNAAIITVVFIFILLLGFAAALLTTRVNGVFIHNAIGIIKMLLESGLL